MGVPEVVRLTKEWTSGDIVVREKGVGRGEGVFALDDL